MSKLTTEKDKTKVHTPNTRIAVVKLMTKEMEKSKQLILVYTDYILSLSDS